MEKKDNYPTTAPKKKEITIETNSNLENAIENSVNKHKEYEAVNISIGADEIKQQNENL
ncbi:hypothetical protein ACH0B5_15045 [Ureibacillus sp. 179-F W5.1 NHS]|uniref:Uncharacterized protein n=1 Tax=Ureibacillus galli TaxID=2762222 RepID=A0ABR8XDZ5_9BACL|nr:hypothetical protein [Ureibacillus galli]MBD8027474.1 hypothetical protein [Ureibacillus galli]